MAKQSLSISKIFHGMVIHAAVCRNLLFQKNKRKNVINKSICSARPAGKTGPF
jgi:hypothetical protein